VVELVRERLSHTLRLTDLAASDFVHYDPANGRCGSRGQAEHRPISLAPKINGAERVSLNVFCFSGSVSPLALRSLVPLSVRLGQNTARGDRPRGSNLPTDFSSAGDSQHDQLVI